MWKFDISTVLFHGLAGLKTWIPNTLSVINILNMEWYVYMFCVW
jgi:hypothetical protein